MENHRPLDEFGKQLITEIRDDSCDFLQQVLSGQMRDATSKECYDAYSHLDVNAKNFVQQIVIASVDACFVRFLNFFDAHGIPLLMKKRNGETANLQALSDGLVGELYSDEGWLAKFSKFRDRIVPTNT